MKKKLKLRFAEMPRDYAALCSLLMPRPIHDRVGYENTVEMAEVFAGFEESMSPDQDDYFSLLCDLIEKYENVPEPNVPPLQILEHLMKESNLTGADLSRLLGASRQLGPMILRGERSITAAHARILAKRFGLSTDLFIG